VSAISTWHPASGVPVPAVDSLAIPSPRRRGSRWLVLAVGVAVVLGAAAWVSNSPVFDLRDLKVDGNTHLTVTQVARLSGLTDQSNVLWTRAGSVEQRLASNPWVLHVTVTRHLPSGITIDMVERVPTAVTAGDPPMLVAGDGTVLGRATPTTELPLIVPPPGGVTVGERLPVSTELAILAVLPDSLRPLVTTVTREGDGSLALLMRDGVTVYYGDGSEVAAKAEALHAVLGWANRAHVHPAYVDVRAPGAPAIGTASAPDTSAGA
jgi:cell division septal protein FtsQ